MENAVDALKIAFGVFVLAMALSIGMYMFNQAKATADVVLASSDTETYAMYTNAIEGIERIRLRFVGANAYNGRICKKVG